MLMLGRKRGDSLTITHTDGSVLRIVVNEVRTSGLVKLGLEGPDCFQIVRDDVKDRQAKPRRAV